MAGQCQTEGLAGLGQSEVVLPLPEGIDVDGAETLLGRIINHVVSGARVLDGQTFGHGYWHVKLCGDGGDRLVVHEPTAEADAYVPGARLAMAYFAAQTEVCARHQAAFLPPRPDQLVALSQGVLEGLPVDAVRYNAPPHMSGWYLWTHQYNGDSRTLRVEHLFHLTALRPDTASFLALPAGFRVSSGNPPVFRFDEAVAQAPPG